MMKRMKYFLAPGLILGLFVLFGPDTAEGQVAETAVEVEDSTAQTPPKPVILNIGFAITGKVWSGARPLDMENGVSLGATGQIPLARHIYLGACIDYHRIKPFTSLFIWSAELVGDLELDRPFRLQGGAGIGYSMLHGDLESFDKTFRITRLSGRLLWQPPKKIGWSLEVVRTDPSFWMDIFTTVRVGVVF